MKSLNVHKISLFIIIILFAYSCENKREISFDKIQNRNGIYYAVNEGPYSGIAFVKDDVNGQIIVKKEFKNGLKEGKSEEWDYKGQKISEINYKEGKLDGKSQSWFENGQKESEREYYNGKPIGLSIKWNSSGQKISEINYKDGKLDGKSQSWYANGQKKSEREYSNDKIIGVSMEWAKNGQKISEINYKDGKLDGKSQSWFEDGQKKSEKEYSNGKRNGVFIRWDYKGQKISVINYKDGKLDGKSQSWFANGQKKLESEYSNDKRNGMTIEWNKSGQKLSEKKYNDGILKYLIHDEKKIKFGTLVDIDSNVYATVKIGSQVWMAENLKVTHYRNGNPILNVTSDEEYLTQKDGAYCSYENDTNNYINYGFLYNWYAVADKRNICPENWHIPSNDEWRILTNYLKNNASRAMKETGTTHWHSPNRDATNFSGFTALPGGYSNSFGFTYYKLGEKGYWWSSSEYRYVYAWSIEIDYFSDFATQYYYSRYKGLSVRCLKN